MIWPIPTSKAVNRKASYVKEANLKKNELIVRSDTYRVKGRGGNLEALKQWLQNIEFENETWQGQLQGNPQDFMASLQLMDAQLISMSLFNDSLEDFFVKQLREKGLTVSQ